MKVLSLCDGMSCAHIALERAGIEVEKYYAAEIKDIGIQVTKANYPDTIFVGDVTKISYSDGVLHTENGDFEEEFDLVCFGSPCNSFSGAMKTDMRIGLADPKRSGLFLECYRILKEINPKWFLLENVSSMKKEDRDILTQFMGVEPIEIDGSLFTAALRKRLYWTNIPGITHPIDRGVKLQDILTSGYATRDKARCLLVSDSRPLVDKQRMLHRFRDTGFTTLIWEDLNDDNSVRYMNKIELCRCQGVDPSYVDCLTRNQAANVLGDGWCVPVIEHIFSFLKNEITK